MPIPTLISGLFNARPKAILALACTALAFYLLIVQVPAMARTRVLNMLESAGFGEASVESVYLRPMGIRATDIKLDASGLDIIKTFDVDLSWPSFIVTGEIKGLRIKDATISSNIDDISAISRKLTEKILTLPDFRLNLSDVVIDISTIFGDIRVRLDASVENADNPHVRKIQAKLTADQYQLGFSSEWEGLVNKDGTLDLTGNIVDGRMNMGPLRISRFNGWAGTGFDGKAYKLQTQLEAGSAAFMDVPLQKLSVISEITPEQTVLSARSGISGMKDVLFTADLTRNEKQESFTAILKGDNFGGLLDYIDETTTKNKTIPETLLNRRRFELTITFQPDRRFVGGPLPFSISLNTDGSDVMEGNALFYSDTMDVRGSLETDTNLAMAFQDYFKIPSENIKQNFIRLDGDSRHFLQSKEQTAN